MNKLIFFWNDDCGASAAEYAMILAILGSAISIGAIGLGTALGNAMGDATICIESDGGTCTH